VKENYLLKGCHVEILHSLLFVAVSQVRLRYARGIKYENRKDTGAAS
jgi:hypothetical protein